jgi:20S proteasome alpha/beta subunit
VTVCVAALFAWSYAPVVRAGLVFSDRMITAGDIQYEPQQKKVAQISPGTLLLIAGDYSVHSQALKNTYQAVQNNPGVTPENIALMYGREIQAIKRREAEDLFLAPLGMNTDTFLAQQKDLSQGFVDQVTNQLQGYRGQEVDALVIGSDQGAVQLYNVDTHGVVSCLDDVGFGAIGIGAWHAKSRLMQSGYTRDFSFARAAAAAFAAKKSAEVAPGVGRYTDIHVIRSNVVHPIWPNVAEKLHKLYDEFEIRRDELTTETVTRLQAFIDELTSQKPSEKPDEGTDRASGGDVSADGGASQTAPESPPDEAGPQQGGKAFSQPR